MNVSKTNGVKLLAAVMVMAMVFAGAAVVLSDSEVNAAPVQNDLIDVSSGSLPEGATYSENTLTLDGYTGKGFYSSSALTIKISGSNTIEADRAGEYAGNAYSAIYATGKITIEADDANDASVVDSLAIKVTGVSTQTEVSESTYGIYATDGIDITGVVIDIDVSTNDPLAFAIAGNGDSTFTDVTGTIDGGNRAIQVGNYTFIFAGCDLTLTGGEKAIQAKNVNSEVKISSGIIRALLNPNYGGPQVGDNDGFGVKATKLTVSNGATLIADGIRISSEEGTATASIDGNVTINDYSYAFSSDVNVNGYTPGFTMDARSTTTISSTGEVMNNSTIVSNGALTNEGNLRNNGTVYNNGAISNSGAINNTGDIRNNKTIDGTGSLNNNGNVYNTTGATITCKVNGNSAMNGFGISTDMDAIESDLPLTGYAFLTGNLTIPEGKSITVRSNGVLDLQGYTLTVKGELIVEVGGTVIGSGTAASDMNPDTIILNNGTIENSGVIGSGDNEVTVMVEDGEEKSSVSMLNVEGVSFGTTKVSNVNYLTVTGDVITAIGNYTSFVFDMDNAYITGEFSIDSEIESTITTGVTVMNGAVFTIDGTVSGDIINMNCGSTVNVMGVCDSQIKAFTGTKVTSSTADLTTYTTVDLNGVNGVTVSVQSNSYVKNNTSGQPTSYTDFVLFISGNVDYATKTESGSIEIENTEGAISKVAADTELVLPDGVTANMGGTSVLGTIEYVEAVDAVDNYDGTRYTVKDGTDSTYFIKEFSAALAEIDTADRKTITVFGEVEVADGFTLADGQTIVIDSEAEFTVSDDALVTIESGARINGTVTEVTGVLTVQRGGNVQSVAKYAVYSEGTDGSKTYAGFIAAIENSNAGDRITVSGVGYDDSDNKLVVEDSVTIPADRTVIITHSIYFDGNLTIDEGATVNNQNSVYMTDENATIYVNGVLDNTSSNADIVFQSADTDGKRNIYASGEFKTDSSGVKITNATVNGAYYQDGTTRVVTTFAKAVEAAAGSDSISDIVYIIGTISESGDVTVSGETTQFVVYVGDSINSLRGYATLGNVTLDYAKVLVTRNSEITGTFIGAYGTEGSTSDASVVLDAAKGISITNSYSPNGLAENVWYNEIAYNDAPDSFTGGITVASGEVRLASGTYSVATGEDDGFTVASGGNLIVPSGVVLNLGKNCTVAGTITVGKQGTVSIGTYDSATPGNNVVVTVAGTIDVQAEGIANIYNMILEGTLNAAENSRVSVTGTMQAGATPKLLGNSTPASSEIVGTITVNTGFSVKIYNGCSVDDMVLMNGTSTNALNGTTYVINGITYATVYDSNGTISDIDAEVGALKDLDARDAEGDIDITWYSGENDVSSGRVGAYDTVTAEIDYAAAVVTVSIGQGITLSVDGVIVSNLATYQGLPLTIGTHQVSAAVDPGFAGDITISFNGQTVTNGQIEITSDMIGQSVVLSATGDISVAGGSSSSSDDGLSLTDYLLIILVVLIVIMAIMVAMRLMRS